MKLRLRHPWRASALLPTCVFLAGACLAAALGWWLREEVRGEAQIEFQRNVERVGEDITGRFHGPVNGLKGVAALYAASPRAGRAEFDAYIEARDPAREFPGVRAFGFVQRVQRIDVDAFVAQERIHNAAHFSVRPLVNSQLDTLLCGEVRGPRFGQRSGFGFGRGL